MARTLTDIFNDYSEVEIIEVAGYDDGQPFGLSSDRRKLKIYDDNFARQLANLPDANTEAGHITDEGYYIRGGYDISKDAHRAWVHRQAMNRIRDELERL